MGGEEERALLSASQPVAEQAEAPTREAVAEIVRAHLGDVYHCTRVWEAWSVGTMGEDDFEPADQSTLADEIADALLAALSQPSAGTAGVAEAPSDEAEFELCGPDDICLAGTIGRRSKAWAEICFYAAQFAKEGPLTIYEVTRKPVSVIGLDASRGGERASGVAPSPAPVVDMERLRHLERVLHEAETAGVKGRKP